MTVVAKLGSSIVADADGDVRGDVLDGVCSQVAGLHQGGEEVVMVTSGAIALGMKLMGFDARPRAIDELQAASAVGQGTLFRAYETRLAAWEMSRGRYRNCFHLGGLLSGLALLAPWAFAGSPAGGAALAVIGVVGLLAYEHAYVQAGQSVPLA